MPREEELFENSQKTTFSSSSSREKQKKYQKKMDMYMDLYEFLKEAKDELYLPVLNVNRFTSHSVKLLVKD